MVRPVFPLYLWSRERLILKNKNAIYNEKTGNNKDNKERKPPKQIEPHLVAEIELASQYVNANRLRNVLSKIGPVTNKDFGKIMGDFTSDIIEDFMKDDESKFQDLEKKERQLITKNIGQRAALLLRENFLNIIDGEF